jgi:hypothetical protein
MSRLPSEELLFSSDGCHMVAVCLYATFGNAISNRGVDWQLRVYVGDHHACIPLPFYYLHDITFPTCVPY